MPRRGAAERGEVDAAAVAQEAHLHDAALASHARFLADVDQRERTGRAQFAAARASRSDRGRGRGAGMIARAPS